MYELNDLLFLIGCEEEIVISSKKDSVTNYLKNGERILTLAKEREHQRTRKCENLTVRFFDIVFPKLHYTRELAMLQIRDRIKKSIRKYFQMYQSKEYLNDECIPFLLKQFQYITDLKISVTDKGYYIKITKDKCKTDIVLKVELENIVFCVPINPIKRFKDTAYYYRGSKNETANICHAELMFYALYIINFVNKFLNEELKNAEFQKLITEIRNNNSMVLNEKEIAFIDDKKCLNCGNIITEVNGYPYLSLPLPIEHLGLSLLHHIISNQQDNVEELKQRKRLEGEVAKAYTTKRNIPETILDKMQNSIFNRYFGFVEFDADIDLKLLDLITQEFIALNQQEFHNMTCKHVALRFRKLGRHHATGLYYPSISTMVVDLRHPSSFFHEYFHMIDDNLNDLSLDYEFADIVYRYQSLLQRAIERAKEEGKQVVTDKGKYNLSYYMRKSEIFARCGEIYLFRILEIKSSLLKPSEKESIFYPDDKRLNQLIEAYYSDLLLKIGENNEMQKGVNDEKDLCVADQ